MNVALVEPYYGGSHRAWADGYRATSHHDVRLITHPNRFWKWRMHGAFLTLADELRSMVADGWVPDVVLASSMMDVSSFAGAIRSFLSATPIVTYFHESQFTYPLSPADRMDLTYQMKNWSSAAVSDVVIFNSGYHRRVFFDEARRFLNAFPEDKHTGFIPGVEDRSIVLPVGIEINPLVAQPAARSSRPLLLWNQRWEHDKGPKELKRIVTALIADDIDLTVAMCGEVFVSVPTTFAEITKMLGDRLIHEGYAGRERYVELLHHADVVLSTAEQEFFGIAVVEAIASGAHPVLPNRLVYPERVDELGFDPDQVLYDSPAEAVNLIVAHLATGPSVDRRHATKRYDWSTVARQYDDVLASAVFG